MERREWDFEGKETNQCIKKKVKVLVHLKKKKKEFSGVLKERKQISMSRRKRNRIQDLDNTFNIFF